MIQYKEVYAIARTSHCLQFLDGMGEPVYYNTLDEAKAAIEKVDCFELNKNEWFIVKITKVEVLDERK